MKKHPLSTQEAILIEAENSLTLQELCITLQADDTIIIAFVEHDILLPSGNTPKDWRFNSNNLKRAKTAISFYHDLEINLNGIALALDLLDQIP